MKTQKYKVLAQIFLLGAVARPGQTVELTDEQARELMAIRPVPVMPLTELMDDAAVETPDAGSAAPGDGKTDLTLLDVMQSLDKDDASLFTSSGAPNCDVLAERLGRPVSAAERDQVWAEITKEAQ